MMENKGAAGRTSLACKVKICLKTFFVAGACWVVAGPLQAQKGNRQDFCRLEGTVVDNPECRYLLLFPVDADLRFVKPDTIPVGAGGKFSYPMRVTANEPYQLVANNEQNGYYNTYFFAEKGTVRFTMYPKRTERRPEIVSEAPLNKELIRMNKDYFAKFFEKPDEECRALEQAGKDMTPEMYEILKKWKSAANDDERRALIPAIDSLREAGKEYTKEYEEAQRRYREAFKLNADYLLDYAAANRTLVGLYFLREQAECAKRYGEAYVAKAVDIYHKHYAKRYVDNEMSRWMRNWIASTQIRKGGTYIDFSAPDLNGKTHRLADEIKEKVALIDFWASWCGPCRRRSESMIPVYEAYRDKGFTVVGVARERDNDAAMRKAIQTDGYPWLNLLELNDRTKLWERYGIGNAGGATVLVDREGKILAVNPTADEVKGFLEQLLK